MLTIHTFIYPFLLQMLVISCSNLDIVWMTFSLDGLKLNADKTEFIIIGTQRQHKI